MLSLADAARIGPLLDERTVLSRQISGLSGEGAHVGLHLAYNGNGIGTTERGIDRNTVARVIVKELSRLRDELDRELASLGVEAGGFGPAS